MLFLTAVPTSSASATTTGPWYIQETNGSFAAGFNSDAAGFIVREVDHPGRFWFLEETGGTYNGDNTVYVESTNGFFMATQTNCSSQDVILKSSNLDTGVVWTVHFSGGRTTLVNRYCDSTPIQGGTGDSSFALAGQNIHGNPFSVCGGTFNCSGTYRALTFVAA